MANNPGSRADAPKLKVDASFIMLVTNDAEWEQKVMQAGEKLLVIVDVYSSMWGPCEMLAGHFSNMFYDLGEDIGMRFVRAESSKTTALSQYKDDSKPRFLFYHNGVEVAMIEGANLPKITNVVNEKAPKLREAPNWNN